MSLMNICGLSKIVNLEMRCCLAGAVMGFLSLKGSWELDWTCDNAAVQINVDIWLAIKFSHSELLKWASVQFVSLIHLKFTHHASLSAPQCWDKRIPEEGPRKRIGEGEFWKLVYLLHFWYMAQYLYIYIYLFWEGRKGCIYDIYIQGYW